MSFYDYCVSEDKTELLNQWAMDLNCGLTPHDVAARSHKKVWWICEKGHKYQSVIEDRTGRGSGCPYCAGRRVLVGFNDLASQNPELAAQWHPTLNGVLTPEMVAPGSERKVWWMCEQGHSWEADTATRTRGSDCPVCTHRTLVPGANDLAATHPELAAQWHPTLNENLSPKDVFAGDCRRKAWWICEKGHEWQAAISSRRSSGCPYCAGKLVLPGFNDLASQLPDVAQDWHPTLNGDLTPQMVTVNSNKKVWWQCQRGHAYQSSVAGHSTGGRGCPYCANRRVLPGFNDLDTVYPVIAAQWHPSLNNELTPKEVTAGSDKKVWWKCNMGHIWKAFIYSRTGPDKCGCPVCAGTINKKRAEKYRAMLAEVGLEWKPDSVGSV